MRREHPSGQKAASIIGVAPLGETLFDIGLIVAALLSVAAAAGAVLAGWGLR
jgi:hypothetical protein